MIFCIFEMRIRYENIKNLGSCLIAFCLSADGYAFGVGPKFFMNDKIKACLIAAEKQDWISERWDRVLVADYEIYVSENGNMISFAKYPKGKILKLSLHSQKDPYPVVNIRTNGVKKVLLVHRLVGAAFLPNPENKPQINHIDGNKRNCSYTNLEWVTDQENKIHAHETGLIVIPRNEQCKLSKPILQLTLAGELVKEWPCTEEIIRQTKFQGPHIRRVANGIRKTAHGFLWRFK